MSHFVVVESHAIISFVVAKYTYIIDEGRWDIRKDSHAYTSSPWPHRSYLGNSSVGPEGPLRAEGPGSWYAWCGP